MRTRPALAAVLAASVALGGAAVAAPKPKPKPKPVPPVCNLVVDDKGDGSFIATPNSTTLDVVSADIATGPRQVTAVIRVDKLADDQLTAHGKQFKLNFVVNGVSHYLRYQGSAVLGESFDYGDQSGANAGTVSKGAATGTVDPATNTITMSMSKSEFAGLKGGTVTEMTAASYFYSGGFYHLADSAEGGRAYKDLTPSCVASK